MVRFLPLATLLVSFCWAAGARASELKGPGRFCGYSPIIDLVEGERVITLQGGIHGGTFRWEGPFGSLAVSGIGWASRPPGAIVPRPTRRGHARFEQRVGDGGFNVAIWNRKNGAAYFSSPVPLNPAQLAAIDRVDLFDEGQERPANCNLRTIFSWE
jgi:hypothetical protein